MLGGLLYGIGGEVPVGGSSVGEGPMEAEGKDGPNAGC